MHFKEKGTIIAMATAGGSGAIAVLRISGENAIQIVNDFFIPKNKKKITQQPSQTVHLGELIYPNKKILDEVLVSIFRSPNSYTGENLVEISCHGSVFIVQKIIALFLENGCRMAKNGEFTFRRFLNGKIDLSQAEAVADLIAADSEASHEIALKQMRKGISNELKILRKKLLDFAALLELELDFSEEDVAFADKQEFQILIKNIIKILKNLMDSFALGNALKNGISVAIIGSPNVGKSTLLNTLIGEEKALVSDIAGTTRDSIEDKVVIEGVCFRFVDTAGLRKTKDLVENMGIQKTYEKAKNAQAILFLMDVEKLKMNDHYFLKKMQKAKADFPKKRLLFIANKIDTIPEKKRFEIQKIFPEVILLSAKEKSGISSLKKALSNLVNTGALINHSTIISNSRHFESLSNALKSITSVQKGIESGISTDLLAVDLRECLKHLGNITGAYDVDKDILGHIFANFCIGK